MTKKEGFDFIGISFLDKIYCENILNENYIIVGQDYENLLGVNKSNCKLFSLSKEENEIIYINSSFGMFKNFIKIFKHTVSLEEEYEETKRTNQVRKLEDIFSSMDKDALADEAWWSFILEQVEDGIL